MLAPSITAAGGVFVTGTDTGVGKTVLAAAVILALRERGVPAVGFKPAETGIDDTALADSEVLRAASGVDEPLATPLVRLGDPLAPAVAAERAGHAIDPAEISERLLALRTAGYTVVMEGAGGLLAPLAWGCSFADLAASTRLPALLVARAGLGTLNHTLLTVEALRARGIPLLGVVLNGTTGDPADLAEATNPDALRRLLPDVAVVSVPFDLAGGALSATARAVPEIAKLLFVG
jgi:dethiobiotin synthetase